MSSADRKFRRRAMRSHIEHRCAVCGRDLGPKTEEGEAFARASGREQGMTDEQMNDPAQSPKICDPCWQRYSQWLETQGWSVS